MSEEKKWIGVAYKLFNDKKRVKRIGVAIYFFLYILEKTNRQTGKCLIKYIEIEREIEINLKACQRYTERLEKNQIITSTPKQYGFDVKIINFEKLYLKALECKGNFTRIKKELYRKKKHREKLGKYGWIYFYMLSNMDPATGKIIRKYETISKATGFSIDSVKEAKSKMERHNYTKTCRNKDSLTYQIIKHNPNQ